MGRGRFRSVKTSKFSTSDTLNGLQIQLSGRSNEKACLFPAAAKWAC